MRMQSWCQHWTNIVIFYTCTLQDWTVHCTTRSFAFFFKQIVVLSISMIFQASLAALWPACLLCVCAVGSDSWSDMDYTLHWHVLWGALNALLSVSVSVVTQIKLWFPVGGWQTWLSINKSGLTLRGKKYAEVRTLKNAHTVYMDESGPLF